jgi:hypothetical protein
MENVRIFVDTWSILRLFCLFYCHSVYFMTIWYICGYLEYFSRFGMFFSKNNLASLVSSQTNQTAKEQKL